MAKIHPNPSIESCTTASSSSSRKETFTVWMKSLVCHGNGCTVFDSRGNVAFRVDNYQERCSKKVFLMDSTGNILFSLNKKKMFGSWEGYKWINSDARMEKPWFQVRRNLSILRKNTRCQVSLGCDENNRSCYTITGFEGKSTLKITDINSGHILAEATQKQSEEGVMYGDDVLRLSVGADADETLVMTLVIVYGLINNKL